MHTVALAILLSLSSAPEGAVAPPASQGGGAAPPVAMGSGGGAPGEMAVAPPGMSGDGGWKPYDYGKGGSGRNGPSSGALVVLAYGLIWGVLLVYVVLLARRQRRLREELDALRDLLERSSEVSRPRPEGGASEREDRAG